MKLERTPVLRSPSMTAFDLDAGKLAARLATESPGTPTDPEAAVAAVFRAGAGGTELLFIQRAKKATDPWSGHMAFPGGRCDPVDSDSWSTAIRETSEEVALDLTAAQTLGSLTPLQPGGGRGGLSTIHAHCFWLDGEPPSLVPNYEVAATVWVPLADLTDRSRYIDYYYPASDSTWPGIQLDDPDQVIWGLTLRFLAGFFDRLDQPFIELAPWP